MTSPDLAAAGCHLASFVIGVIAGWLLIPPRPRRRRHREAA